MTCNTSAVAVCCSNASRVSVISRAFSIAITACAAKFCNSAICLSVNGRTSWRNSDDDAKQRIVLAQRNARAGADTTELDASSRSRVGSVRVISRKSVNVRRTGLPPINAPHRVVRSPGCQPASRKRSASDAGSPRIATG